MKKRKTAVSLPLKYQKSTSRKILMYAGLLGVFFLLLTASLYTYQSWLLKTELNDNNREIMRLQEINREMREEIVRLQDDKYIEFLARRHLGLSRPDDGSAEKIPYNNINEPAE